MPPELALALALALTLTRWSVVPPELAAVGWSVVERNGKRVFLAPDGFTQVHAGGCNPM